MKDKGEEWRDVKVYGQEINAGTAAIARMNLYLHGIHDFSIVNDDTLERPAFTNGGRVQQFDVVLANPPYSIKQWNREAFEHDKYGRNFLGVPPQARADYAFIQHILASMDVNNGRCAVLLPHGVLNRREELEIRKNHIAIDNIDAVIGLGRNLFFNSGLESFILICNNRKSIERKGRILFIEAENYTHKEGKQAYLGPEDIAKIVHAYNNYEDEVGFSKWVNIEDIEDGNLNIKSYVKSASNNSTSSAQECILAYKKQQHLLADAMEEFELIDSESVKIDNALEFSSIDKSKWRKVTLGEVAYEYSSRVDNPSESQYDYFIGSDCIGQYDFRITKKSPANIITSAQKEFKSGDYLLVRRSLYGSDFRERAPRADFDGCCSADILTIRENHDFISDGYLINVLYSKDLWDFIVANSAGGLTRRIKWKQIADFEFLLPPKEEQKVLAEKLWAAYEVKQSYLKMIEATQEMVKSQFIEMFKGDYQMEKWEDCLTITNGKKDDGDYQESGSFPICGSGGIMGYGERKFCDKDTIILGRKGNINSPIYMENDYWIVDTAFSLAVNRQKLQPKYFYFWCKRFDFTKYNKQGVLPSLTKNDLQKIEMPIPPMELQTSFVVMLEQADKSENRGELKLAS